MRKKEILEILENLNIDTNYVIVRRDRIIPTNVRLSGMNSRKKKILEKEYGIKVYISDALQEAAKLVNRAINKYKLFNPKETVILGYSGGKDSLLLLHLLEPYERKLGLKIKAVNVDLSIEGERPWKDSEMIKKHCDMLEIDFVKISYDEDLSEIRKRSEFSTCFICSNIRRYLILNSFKNIRKIVLAHNLNDNVNVLLSSLINGRFRILEYIKSFDEFELNISENLRIKLPKCIIVRPMLDVNEALIIKSLKEVELEYFKDKLYCRYSRERENFYKKIINEMFNKLEERNPNARKNLIETVKKYIICTSIYQHRKK